MNGEKVLRSLTTNEAAEIAGMSQSAFRGAMTRARAEGVEIRLPENEWPDKRSPRWDEAALREWLAQRPGRGNWAKTE